MIGGGSRGGGGGNTIKRGLSIYIRAKSKNANPNKKPYRPILLIFGKTLCEVNVRRVRPGKHKKS